MTRDAVDLSQNTTISHFATTEKRLDSVDIPS